MLYIASQFTSETKDGLCYLIQTTPTYDEVDYLSIKVDINDLSISLHGLVWGFMGHMIGYDDADMLQLHRHA